MPEIHAHAHGPYNGIPWWVWLFLLGAFFIGVGWVLSAAHVDPGFNFGGLGKVLIATPFVVAVIRIVFALI